MPDKCWCGTRRPYFAPLPGRCGGYGHISCFCGGDFCVCHNHGDVECDGCEDCEPVGEGEASDEYILDLLSQDAYQT